MSKFSSSEEAISSDLLLWSTKNTQTGIKDVRQVDYFPINSFSNSDTINFDLQGLPNAMVKNIQIITSLKVVKKNDDILSKDDNISVVSNFAQSLWKLVDIVLNSRVSIMSPMHQSYNLESFFNIVLNEDSNRKDKLFNDQLFLLDDAKSKEDSESCIFTGDNIVNPSAVERAGRIAYSKMITLISDLNCSLFKQRKLLPTNLNIGVSLTKNDPDYFLLHDGKNHFKVVIEKVFLRVTYVHPEDFVLSIIEEKLKISPAIYECNRTEISTFGVPLGVTSHMFNNIYRGIMPSFVVFALQDRDAMSGASNKNPFTFHRFESAQIYLNNREFYPEPLSSTSKNDQTLMFNNFYKAIGNGIKGDSLINPDNYQTHYMLPVPLSRDQTVKFHYNIQEEFDFKIKFTFDKETDKNLILIVYSIYDRLVKIDSLRNIELVG